MMAMGEEGRNPLSGKSEALPWQPICMHEQRPL
jgi:hypothetical protein